MTPGRYFMITSSIFNILEIEETRDENLIKNAYRKKLITVNPEDNPEGFVQLREAYEEALRLSKEAESPEWATDTPVGQWTQQIDDIYTRLDKRIDATCWETLFESSFFRDLDTGEEAKKAVISYLTRHYFLPKSVWKVIDDACEVELRIDEYTESFPRDFLKFFISGKNGGVAIPLELFVGSQEAEYDNFIRTYFELRNLLNTEDVSGAIKLFGELENADISHPYIPGERIRYAVKVSDSTSIRKWIEVVIQNPVSCRDVYLLFLVALGYWALGDYDAAKDYAEKVLEESPEHIGAKKLLCDYDSQKGFFEKAHETYIQILETSPFDAELSESFQKNVKLLIEKREQTISESTPAGDRIELCWNYYQTTEFQKALDTLLTVTPETEDDAYSYTNLIGRLYLNLDQHEAAVPYLLKWKEYIYATIDDKTEKSRKRLTRKGTVDYFLAEVSLKNAEISKSEKDYTTALSFLDKAIENEAVPRKLEFINRKAAVLIAAGRNEECIDYCTVQLEENESWLPFYLYRQQAAYNLKLGQDVINDFYSINRVAPQIIKPYTLAAEVFMNSGQYGEAHKIIELAGEAGIESPKLQLIEITVRRFEATNPETTKHCLNDLFALDEKCSQMDPQECDIEDRSDIRLQICYAQMDLTNFNSAQHEIECLRVTAPDNATFVRVLSDIYRQSNRLFESEVTLTTYLKKHPEDLSILFALADIHTQADKHDLALAIYEKILAISPTHKIPYIKMNRIYLKRNMEKPKAEYLTKALETINKQIAISDDPESLFQRGLTNLDIGDLNCAIEDFKSVIEVDSGRTGLCYGYIGDAYKFQRDFEKALEFYQTAFEAYKGEYNFYAFRDLAVCFEALHRYDEALEVIEKIIQHQPANIEAYLIRGRVYLKQQNYTKANVAYMIAVQKAEPHYLRNEAERNLLACSLLMNDMAAAWATIKTSIFFSQPNTLHCRNAGDYFWLAKRNAGKALQRYISGYNLCKSSNDTWEAENIFAIRFLEIYHEQKNISKIKKHSMQFFSALNAKFGNIETYVNHPHERKQRCFLVGRIFYYNGEIQEARKYFDQMDDGKNCILCSYSKCVRSIAGHAMILEAEGRYEEAIAGYEEVIAAGYAGDKYIPHVRMLKKKAKIKS